VHSYGQTGPQWDIGRAADPSEVLRRLGRTKAGRRAAIGALSTRDVWRIWRWTRRLATARDRRTHQEATAELRRRGILLVH
jgi:hypothetical protein